MPNFVEVTALMERVEVFHADALNGLQAALPDKATIEDVLDLYARAARENVEGARGAYIAWGLSLMAFGYSLALSDLAAVSEDKRDA